MKRAALGVHMHSGWGVLVAVFQDAGPVETVAILDRRRIVIADAEIPGAIQPYHYASRLEFSASEKYLANCAAASSHLASTAIAEVTKELEQRHFRINGAAVLLASGRPLPPLAKILASHPTLLLEPAKVCTFPSPRSESENSMRGRKPYLETRRVECRTESQPLEVRLVHPGPGITRPRPLRRH
jgi:hypothetical protein